MGDREKSKLSGVVEVDETFVGGVRPGKAGRGALGKVLVAVAAEVRGEATGRIRLVIVPNSKAETLLSFVKDNVEPGSHVVTDGLTSYSGLAAHGYPHANGPDPDPVPHAHKAMSLLKRWLLGTHQGRIEAKYLQRYLDEFVFRFNRRDAGNRGGLFLSLISLCLVRRGRTLAMMKGEAQGGQSLSVDAR